MNLYTSTEAAAYLGIHPVTLRLWERTGKIAPTERTVGGHRRYSKATLDTLRDIAAPQPARKTIVYARVSSSDQKSDLVRQIDRLLDFCAAHGWVSEVLQDLGSGLNYKKPGLRKLMALIQAGEVERLILTHKDRLLRFGAELVFELCDHHGTSVIIIEENENAGFEIELARDVIELVTVFAARLYGARSHKAAQAVAAVTKALSE